MSEHNNDEGAPPPREPPKFFPPQNDNLTIEQRGCLLRAARRQLLAFEEELDRYRASDGRRMHAVIEATEMERDCLDEAISWLWRQHLGG